MTKYVTKQRKALLDFFLCHTDEALSARQIAASLEGGAVSVSAVYRNLAALEQAGLVKRMSKVGSHEVFYQYTDAPECRERLHLSCKKCGKTYHMDSSEAELLIRSIAKTDNFAVDKTETVLYGLCVACQ